MKLTEGDLIEFTRITWGAANQCVLSGVVCIYLNDYNHWLRVLDPTQGIVILAVDIEAIDIHCIELVKLVSRIE